MTIRRKDYSQEAINRINIILKLVKDQLKNKACPDVFSIDDKVEAIETALSSVNGTPPFTNISFEDKECENLSNAIAYDAVSYLENRLSDRQVSVDPKPVTRVR